MKNFSLFTFLVFILGSTALSPVLAQDELIYVPVDPCRIVDTRNAGGAITANTNRNFRVSGSMGELAVQGGTTDCLDPKAGAGQKPLAISAYVVAVPASGSTGGVLTAYPSHRLPPPVGAGSTVNFAAGQVIGNTTNITLCDQVTCPSDGEFSILARNTKQHVVIDVQGYFYPSSTAKQPVAVDADGKEIGIIIGGKMGKVFMYSPQGFVGRVRTTTGRIAPSSDVYFTDADCGNSGGVAYLDFYDADYVPGSVFDNTYSSGLVSQVLWYLPKPATLLDNVPVQSVRMWDFNASSVICAAASVTLTTGARIFPNNPAVTGFPNAAFPAPITIEYR